MTPIGYQYFPNNNKDTIRFSPRHPHEFDKTINANEILPVYTANEIGNFIRGLYFDDDFKTYPIHIVGSIFSEIADKIEKESRNETTHDTHKE